MFLLLALPALILWSSTGCAAPLAFRSHDGQHRLCVTAECYQLGPLAPPWQVVQREDGQIGFYNPSLHGVIESGVACRADTDAAPLSSFTDHLLVGYTERRVRSTATLPFLRREALRTVLDVKLDGVPMVLDIYVAKRNGCLIDLTFAAAPSEYERGVTEFQRFVTGFTQLAVVGPGPS